MTEVDFHSGVSDRLGYACRLIRKAWRAGRLVVVHGPSTALSRLDQMLWTFDPSEFIPHARLGAGHAMPARLLRTPIWLVDRSADAPSQDVLVHLGLHALDEPQRFARVVEIVGQADDEVAAGRQRWRTYKAVGLTLRNHAQDGLGA